MAAAALRGWSPPYAHVQSYVLAMRRATLRWVLDHTDVFDPRRAAPDYTTAVLQKEVLLSQTLLRVGGWNISCLAGRYRGADYRAVTVDPNPSSYGGDACFPGAYFGGDLDINEVLFLKSERFFGDRSSWCRTGLAVLLVCMIVAVIAARSRSH